MLYICCTHPYNVIDIFKTFKKSLNKHGKNSQRLRTKFF